MPNFFVLRAAPATGKSTWVAENDLSDITVSSDEWRIRINGIGTDENGREYIPQHNQGRVWSAVKDDVRERMKRGEENIILDSVALRPRDIRTCDKAVKEYGYDAWVVEFYHDVSCEECLSRNAAREQYKQVPDYVIERFYEEIGNCPVPDGYIPISPDEALAIIGEQK